MFSSTFAAVGFLPHGGCYLWIPSLVWLHAISDGLIALAYFSIPLSLIAFVRKRVDVPYPRLFILFGIFILACGLTHLLEVVNIWREHYYLAGYLKAFTAAISLVTAVGLIRIIPAALAIPGAKTLRELNTALEERVRKRTLELEKANTQLTHEVGERQKAEADILRLNQALQRRVEELNTLIEILPIGVGIADSADCTNIRGNPALATLLGLDVRANTSLSAPDEEAPSDFRVYHENHLLKPDELPIQRAARENRQILGFSERVDRKDGTSVELIANAVPIRDKNGDVVGCVGTFQDLTKILAAHQNEARYAAIVASSEDAIVGQDLNGVVTEWNHGAERIFGFTAEEMIGTSIERIIPADRLSQERIILERVARGEAVPQFDTRRRCKGGKLVEVSVRLSPIRDAFGRIVGASKLARDNTERNQMEKRRLDVERKIQETQKLESLGVLAGGIAHDFNNLLTGILGNATLARTELQPGSALMPYVDRITEASRRAADLCHQMLAYSGRGHFVISELDLNQLVSETTHLLGISISKNCVLRQNPSSNIPKVAADATQIRQILMNLVINASEAIGKRSGVIAITTGAARIDEDYRRTLLHEPEIALGDYVFLEVSDNGGGMSAATIARIFEPFYTTKFTGRGLGLAAVLGIVRGHKGALKVYSEQSRGSTFKLFLPCAERAITAKESSAVDDGRQFRGSGTVLVVDDEETVRAVTARSLEVLGYQVETASDGREAFVMFAKNPSHYRIVVMDLTMPHMDGEETFRQLRNIQPAVRVVLMSGFNEEESISRFVGKGLAGFVQKPFDMETLTAAIKAAELQT